MTEPATPIGRAIDARMKELGISFAEAARRAGHGNNPFFVRDIVRGRSSSPRADTLKSVAAALDMNVADLVSSAEIVAQGFVDATRRRHRPSPTATKALSRTHGVQALLGINDVPVYGPAAGAMTGGDVMDFGDPLEYVARPPAMSGAPRLYAVRVAGDSMAPWHPDGSLRYVHPTRPPRAGDVVVITQTENGTTATFIKMLRKITDTEIVCEQTNPGATIRFKRDTVTRLHKVLTIDEMFGA